MERKGNTEVVTVEEMKSRLTGNTVLVTPEEERVLRMRHGVSVGTKAPLARAAGNNAELADELLLMEMQFARAMRARETKKTVTATSSNPAKAKIVRALRKKK